MSMEGQGLICPMEGGGTHCGATVPLGLQQGLGLLAAAGRGHAACQMVGRSHQ